ncbi:hypothetical protein CAL7716_049350 [Calothrix sp. PCC 7716]|nr:hypothetical protein CAL7716_049350 [Calothrix sp. PCC 7716]
MPLRIFISYAREDNEFADRLFGELNRHPDITPWIDTRNLLPGANWKDKILNEIETSDFILLLLSTKSITKDGFFQREMREAIERLSLIAPGNRVLIPIRVEECEPQHRELRLLNYLDLFPDWERGIIRLYEALGVRRYTHIYTVSVDGGFRGCGTVYLIPIEQQPLSNPNNVTYVSLLTIPKLEWTRIPSEGLLRQGGGNSYLAPNVKTRIKPIRDGKTITKR